MKKLAVIFLLVISFNGNTQTKNIFSKDPIINLETWQKKRLYFGYYLGFNNYDFKFDYKEYMTNPITGMPIGTDIQVKKTTGFNVGVVANLRLHEYISLRFEPGLYYSKRDLYFPITSSTQGYYSSNTREVNSTYINFPLLFKFSALRTGNIRPYLLGGASTTLNLSANNKSIDDNLTSEKFRVKPWTFNYEIGFGIDIFTEYFIFSPSIRGQFGIGDELIRDNTAPSSAYTDNIDSMKSRALLVNFTFH